MEWKQKFIFYKLYLSPKTLSISGLFILFYSRHLSLFPLVFTLLCLGLLHMFLASKPQSTITHQNAFPGQNFGPSVGSNFSVLHPFATSVMATAASPPGRLSLETLPPEVRSWIWDAVGQQEDFSCLVRTSRKIRHEILSRIPGAFLSCACLSTRPCRCGQEIEIDQLAVIVEPDCSERRWLKFSVGAGGRTACVWCVADLDSPLARTLCYYRPREIVIDFRVRRRGNWFASFLPLRAKLFDVCKVLGWFQPQQNRSLLIRFRDPWIMEGKQPRGLSTWEACVISDYRTLSHRHLWRLTRRPLCYECLLIPLCLHRDWRNAKIIFDRKPQPRDGCTFAYSMKADGRIVKSEDFGYEALNVAAWAYMDQLVHDGVVSAGEDDLTPYFEQYDTNTIAWAAEKGKRVTLRQTFYSYLKSTMNFTEHFDIFLKLHSIDCEVQLRPLRSYILRTRNSSSVNSFSEKHPNTEAEDWQWNHDLIRQAYVHWAVGDREYTNSIGWKMNYNPLWPRNWPRSWPHFHP
jgi:hypothetical protein